MTGAAARPPGAAPASLRLCSVLGEEFRAELEELLFFNPRQGQAAAGIEESIARHGVPEIVCSEGQLHVHVGTLGRAQVLFALHPAGDRDELAGVLVYSRLSVEEAVVLHIAVREQFAADGGKDNQMVVLRLVAAVRSAAARLKGVRVMVIYDSNGPFQVPVSCTRGLASVVA